MLSSLERQIFFCSCSDIPAIVSHCAYRQCQRFAVHLLATAIGRLWMEYLSMNFQPKNHFTEREFMQSGEMWDSISRPFLHPPRCALFISVRKTSTSPVCLLLLVAKQSSRKKTVCHSLVQSSAYNCYTQLPQGTCS